MNSGFATAGGRDLAAPAPAEASAVPRADTVRLEAARLYLARAARVAEIMAGRYDVFVELVGVARADAAVAEAGNFLRRAQAEYDRAFTAAKLAAAGK